MIRAMIFDLDGTLIDTPTGIVKAFCKVLTDLGFKNVPESAIRNTIGMPLESAFSVLMEVSVADNNICRAIELYQQNFREIILPKAPSLLFPGVKETLEQLKKEGKLLAIATSKYFKSAEALLKAAGIQHFFDVIIGADQVTKPKPDPEMGFMVMSMLGVTSDESVMVGDTTHDLKMANSAGMTSIAVTYGIHDIETLRSEKPSLITSDFRDILNFVIHY
ncbi:MAG: HAD family hydrolase [Bacteroidetes bacterium]|nr:HAD family hydrolase [Bacteroidota bacterium]